MKSFPTKINIGCGYDKRPDFLNIDSDPACAPDILIINNDLSGLPQGHFEEAIALDVLEHIPRAQMMGALFDWAALLKAGGRLFIETSYIYGIIDVMRRADDFETAHNWKTCLFGNQAHPGDWHCNGFTKRTLRTYLHAVGLSDEGLEIRDEWLIYGWATKTMDWSDFTAISDPREFLTEAFRYFLGREPESFRFDAAMTAPGSKERMAEIKTLACSEERLYRIGRELDLETRSPRRMAESPAA